MTFSPGDKVRFLDEKGEGIIKKIIDKNTVLVEIETGFEVPFLIKKLVKVSFEEETIFSPTQTSSEKRIKVPLKDPGPAYSKKSSKKQVKHPVEEVDLHIDQLIDHKGRMSNTEIIQIQLNYFQTLLDRAIQNNVSKIVFIHGVGEGVLKAELRRILDRYENISYYDASYRKYGFGATEVVIR